MTSVVAQAGPGLAGAAPTAALTLTGPGGLSKSLSAWTTVGRDHFEKTVDTFSVRLTSAASSASLGLTLDTVGNVAPTAPPVGLRIIIDDEKLRDVLLLTTIMTTNA